jgi:aspartyl-tRNA(Asn)/glutamyl-tRNA(Gln) amidotransferase subunit B
VLQETRHWHEDTGVTTSGREKSDADDYRYFPEPDLVPVAPSRAWVEAIRRGMPELPEARKLRLMAEHGLGEYDSDLLVRLIAGGADYFEAAVRAGAPAKAVSNWIQGEVRRKLKDAGADDMMHVPIPADALAELIDLVERGVVSSTVAKDVFERAWTSGQRPRAIVEAEGLAQVTDTAALAAIVDAVMAQHADAVAQYRGGKTGTFGFLVGQVMKQSGGKANPKVVSELLRRALES